MEGISVKLLVFYFFFFRNFRQIENECRWTSNAAWTLWWESKPSCKADSTINLKNDHNEVVKRSPLYRPLHIPLQILPHNSSVFPYFLSNSQSLQRSSVIMSASSRGRLTVFRVQCTSGRTAEASSAKPTVHRTWLRGGSNGAERATECEVR
jgi:hypothetical protein